MATISADVEYSRGAGYAGNGYGGTISDAQVKVRRVFSGAAEENVRISVSGRGTLREVGVTLPKSAAMALAGLLTAVAEGNVREVEAKI